MNTKPANFITVGASPLLKGSDATNFIYEIENLNLTNDKIANFSLLGGNDQIECIYKEIASIRFNTVEGKIFQNNLILIESWLPKILADIVLYAYQNHTFDLLLLLDGIAKVNPLKVPELISIQFYTHKVKELLRHLVLGMQPSIVWHGESNIYDHYPIIEDGDEIIYYTDSINKFIEIVIQKTTLKPSDSLIKEFGNLYFENEKLYLKLNFQLTFQN